MTTVDGLSIKDGDVFHWSYLREVKHGDYSYWCKSQIAIAKDGLLVDTYCDSSAHWSYEDAPKKLDLTFLGNLADLVNVPEYNREYYADSDIVNLNHANSSRGNFYIRRGAQRSKEKMLETAHYKMEKAQKELALEYTARFGKTHKVDLRSAQQAIERFVATIKKIEEASDLAEIYL
jgi:hypothetical protein